MLEMNLLADSGRYQSFSPSTGGLLAEAQAAPPLEVGRLVMRARAAEDAWSRLPLSERLTRIQSLHQALARDADEIARLLSAETGRPLQESLGAEVLPTLAHLRFLGREAGAVLRPRRITRSRAWSYAQPYGVVGVIGTWNYPLFLNLVPIAQAMAAGCTVVWKPSEHSIASAMRIERLLEQAGFPAGSVCAVYGGAETGRALAQAGCDKIVFTGSARTGKAILAELARTGTPSVMELSGNDAFLVCSDAPLELAVRSAVWGRVSNGGQSCVAPQRFYVHRSVYRRFLESARRNMAALRADELTPLRTAEFRDRCHRAVRQSVEMGARLLHGGGYDPDAAGFHYAPTLLMDCEDTMPVMAEDLFGPVIAVCPVDDEDEAIERANGGPFALGASVWTCDTLQGRRMAARLKAGLVSINDVLLDAADPAVSFGGLRASGFGKQRGLEGLEEFIVRKFVVGHIPDGPRRHLFPYVPAAVSLLQSVTRMQLPGGWRALPDLVKSAIQWRRERRML